MGQSKRQAPAWAVIALAYFHRYGWILLMLICTGTWSSRIVGIMGGFMVAVALWSFVGYKLEWRHIYCSYQEANHQKCCRNFVRAPFKLQCADYNRSQTCHHTQHRQYLNLCYRGIT